MNIQDLKYLIQLVACGVLVFADVVWFSKSIDHHWKSRSAKGWLTVNALLMTTALIWSLTQ